MHEPMDVQTELHEALRRPRIRRLKLLAGVAVAAAVGVVGVGTLTRVRAADQLKTWTAAQAVPAVQILRPSDQAGAQQLLLPGTVQAFYNAPLYARVNGYVKTWRRDIGDHVKAGEVLAVIDTPELDQQLAQAKANLASAVAAQQLAQVTANRWTKLLGDDAVSKQEQQEKAADLLTKTAAVKAAQAQVDQYQAETSFQRLVAPFDGVVTARKTDVGDLVNAGASSSASELFDVADVHKLRIYVRVPQNYSAELNPGMTAELAVPEYPGRKFTATMVGSADAVNDQSGTVLVQLLADNGMGQMKPGDYAQVTFAIAPQQGVVTAPASALIFRRTGVEVATVGRDNRIVMRPVVIARDLGTTVEIASGLGPQDRVVDNPPDSLADGELVRVTGVEADRGGAHGAG
jgi:multidrug efflux system membrane fusion protein